MPNRRYGAPGRLAGILVACLLVAGAGCKDTTRPGPTRLPRAFFVPTDISLEQAPDSVIAGDTLWVTQSPFLPLGRTLEFRSDQTPLLIRGTKSYPGIAVLPDSMPVFKFASPRAGTRVEHLLLAGGTNSLEVSGQGTLVVDDCLFRNGSIQVQGTGFGKGLRVEISGCLMTDAGRYAVNLTGKATLASTQNTMVGAGDCGVLLENGARGDIRRTLVYGSVNYGLACESGGALADSSGCNDVYQSGTASYLNCTAPESDSSRDPQFCNGAGGDYSLFDTSPCAAANSGSCGRIGARDPGCSQ